jgi:hypothetical protein
VLDKNGKHLPIHLVARKHNGLKPNPTRPSDADCTLKIRFELSGGLAGFAAVIMGKSVRSNFLQRTGLDPPNQRWRKVQRIVVLIRTNLFGVWVEPRSFISRQEVGNKPD